MSFFKKLWKKEEEEKPIEIAPVKTVQLDIVDTMHQTMALTISRIAKVYPKQFDMVKGILTEYAFLIENVLVFRSTGNPDELFKKLVEFMLRSVEGYLEKYQNNEVVDEEKPVKDIIMDGLIQIEEAIEKYEGIQPSLPTDSTSPIPTEDWSKKPKIKKRGGLPSLNTPIEDVKGIGADTAKKLREIGVDTLEKYVEYQKVHESNNEEDVSQNE